MNKQQKEQIKKEFLARPRKVIVNGSGWSVPIDEYMEQEKWARPVNPPIYEQPNKVEVRPTGDDGILSRANVIETDLWYLRNHKKFDLRVRNARRVGH